MRLRSDKNVWRVCCVFLPLGPNATMVINLILDILDQVNPRLCLNKNKLIGDGAYENSF